MLIDGRNPEEFAQGHLRHAINVGLEGRYAEFAGSVIASDVDILLITEPGHELEGKNRLARIGFDRVVGYLDEPYKVMFKHRDEVEIASRLTAATFEERRASVADLQIVDVRNPGEVAERHDPGSGADPSRATRRTASTSSTRRGRPSCTAGAGTDRRSPPACSASAGSTTSATSSAATQPGPRSRRDDPGATPSA